MFITCIYKITSDMFVLEFFTHMYLCTVVAHMNNSDNILSIPYLAAIAVPL